MGALFLFAMLHGFGIWWEDILSLYAATGVIMLFCRSLPPKTLLLIGVILFAVTTARDMPPGAIPSLAPDASSRAVPQHAPDATAAAQKKIAIAADFAEAKRSWRGAYQENAREYLHQLSKGWRGIPDTLGLMMIGLSLFKSGFFAARSSRRRYRAVMVIGTVALAMVAWITWQADVAESPTVWGHVIGLLVTPFVSLAYAASLILLLRGDASRLLAPFAATGRIAFTNYLTQSMLMTSIFYGGRGALMGEVDRPALWGIVICVWVLQLIWSPLWLARFEMGPLEWVWRYLTYGHRVPFVKRA
ncbi:hypothetical protein GCM10010872_13540 [Dyella flava]|nr:hypothetical protein GCM10010872_13540 [Dyella flava]